MPIPKDSRIEEIIISIPGKIKAYNSTSYGSRYNSFYIDFIKSRLEGIYENKTITQWLKGDQACKSIYQLLKEFGMDSRSSKLVSINSFYKHISDLYLICNPDNLVEFPIYRNTLNSRVNNSTIALEISKLYNYCYNKGIFSLSGGFVIATKVLHCIIPELFPIIDSSHIGISLYNVFKQDYTPTQGTWDKYLGHTPKGKVNPSPRGEGRTNWGADQYLCAIGFYSKIYNAWQEINKQQGLEVFLSLDPVEGTTGIPRLLDKVFW